MTVAGENLMIPTGDRRVTIAEGLAMPNDPTATQRIANVDGCTRGSDEEGFLSERSRVTDGKEMSG